MSEFFILQQSPKQEDLFVKSYEDPRDFGDCYFLGEPLAASDERARLFYDEGRKTDYVAGMFSFPVVSARFQEILCEVEPANAELHGVELICTTNNEVDDTYVFSNILEHVSCLDWERSRLVTAPNAPDIILRVERLVLQEDMARGRHLFRIEDLDTLIIVSSALRQRVEDAGLTGIGFMDTADYREWGASR